MVNLRRLLTVLALCLAAVLVAPGVAAAQPNSGDSGSFGFDETCNEIHDTLDGIGIPGGPSLGDLTSTVCKGGNVVTHPGSSINAAKDAAWDSTFGKVVDSLMTGLGQAIILSLTWWTKIPNEKISDSGALFTQINDYTYQAQILLLIASIILSGARLAEARRGAAMSEATESFKMYARVVFSSWMLGAVIVAGTQVSDRFSAWLIDDVTNGNAKGVAELMVKTSTLQGFSPGLVLIIAIVGLLGALAQAALAVIRQGLLVVAAGFLPMAAAASGMKTGQQSYAKLTAWVIAFLLWKPVAAIVYMIAFVTADVGTKDAPIADVPTADQAQRVLVGLVLLCSVAFVLPALMRLVTPAIAVAGTGGSGLGATGGTLIAGAALATGGKSMGIKGTASPGAAGFVGNATKPTGAAGGRSPGGAVGPPGGRGPTGGGGPGGGGPGGGGNPRGPVNVPSGGGAANPGGAGAAVRIGAATGGGMRSADSAAGDVAGDNWGNRDPNLGRSTIPR